MKKIIALFILFAATAVIVSGCTAVNTAAASFHNSAVSFARTTSKAKAKAKIQELVDDGKITHEYGKELSAKADADLDAIFAKIDEYYAKYKVLKEAKLAAKKNTETKTAESAPAEKKAE